MSHSFPALELPTRLLHGPGPSPVPASVLAALAKPTIGHMDPQFLRVMNEIREMLQVLFGTENEMTLACSGTGSAGAEMLATNLVEPGDRCLVCVNGVFGGRFAEKCRRAGGEVTTLQTAWGTPFEQDDVIAKIDELKPQLVMIVHAETSTGVHQPIDRLAAAAHRHDTLLVLDCVTSLGGLPVEIDRHQVDAAFSGTQKCLSCPPGLAPVTLSPRAMHRVAQRQTPVRSWYLDLSLVGNYWAGTRAYHHTAPVNMNYALHEALRLILDEGLDARYARHQQSHALLKQQLAERGYLYASAADHTLPMLNLIHVPEQISDEAATRKQLLEEHGIEIGGGLGEFAGKCWRIGLMGHGARPENVEALVKAFDAVVPAAS